MTSWSLKFLTESQFAIVKENKKQLEYSDVKIRNNKTNSELNLEEQTMPWKKSDILFEKLSNVIPKLLQYLVFYMVMIYME